MIPSEQQDMLHRQPLWTKSFVALTCSMFLLLFNMQLLLSSFSAYVETRFMATDFMVSLVTSCFAFSAIAARFVTAAMMRTMSYRLILTVGLSVATASTLAYMLADSFIGLLILRMTYGFGFGMASTIIPTIVSRAIPGNRIGEGIGYFGLSTSLAMSIGPMIGMNVMDEYGFNPLAVFSAVVALLIFPLYWFWLEAARRATPEHFKKTDGKSAPFSMKVLLLPAFLNTMLGITFGGIVSFIALFGRMTGIEQVGLFFLFNVLMIVVARPISGKIFDKKGHAPVLIPGAVSVGIALILLSYTSSTGMLIISAMFYGYGLGSIQPTLQAWMLRSVPQSRHGNANSMFYNTTEFGVAIGSMVLGAISTLTNYSVMYRMAAVFMLVFIVVYIVLHMGGKPRSLRRTAAGEASGTSQSS